MRRGERHRGVEEKERKKAERRRKRKTMITKRKNGNKERRASPIRQGRVQKKKKKKTKDIKTGPSSLMTPHNQAQGRGRKPGSLTSTFGLNVR